MFGFASTYAEPSSKLVVRPSSKLVVSPATAAKHVENIREKLGLASRTQIATWVLERDAASAD
jgi:hypothetical protein